MDDVLILDASHDAKMSKHIVFTETLFKDSLQVRAFVTRLVAELRNGVSLQLVYARWSRTLMHTEGMRTGAKFQLGLNLPEHLGKGLHTSNKMRSVTSTRSFSYSSLIRLNNHYDYNSISRNTIGRILFSLYKVQQT